MQQLRFKFYLSKIKRTIRIRYILNCFYAFLFDKVNQKREGIKKKHIITYSIRCNWGLCFV